MEKYQCAFIDGAWVAATGDETIAVINPSTEQAITTIRSASAADVEAAVAAARRALSPWSATTPVDRAALIVRASSEISRRLPEIGTLIATDVGMPLPLSMMIQAGLPGRVMESYGAICTSHAWEFEIGNSLVRDVPVGVVGAITPWNYPLHQLVAKTAAALAAGCTVVAKPSEVAPLSAYVLAEILDEVGLPRGVFNLVVGGPSVGQQVVAHPGIDMISFTGSARAGREIASTAGRRLARVSLELGGKSANIMLDDAPLAESVDAAVTKCFLNSGQTCTALTRLLVPRALIGDVEQAAIESASRFVLGDPLDPSTRLGPVVSDLQRQRVREYIRTGVSEGARLICGGADAPQELPVGYFVRPTVFSSVDNQMVIAREEIFGPVLAIIPYDSQDDAITIANDSPYGLSGGVMSADGERALSVARQIRTGQIAINNGSFNPEAPFGGFGDSGYGRELGSHGMAEFLTTIAIHR